ncbi:MAG: hypothetical protein K8I60_10265, partial [Anaerolineae bacterium]|nr:hypothetical protein [Anaerolineae bacterium]
PNLIGTYTRVTEVRLQQPQFAGYTPEKYFTESILHPGNYMAPPYPNSMLPNFGDRLTLQNLADLIAFLETQTDPSPE